MQLKLPMAENNKSILESQAGISLLTENKLDYLAIIVTMSPLLGLLGTIVGMIGAFSIFNLESGAPIAITGGIGRSTYRYCYRSLRSYSFLVCSLLFCHPYDNMITDMEQCFSALLEAETRSGK